MVSPLEKAKLIIAAYNNFTRDHGLTTSDICARIPSSSTGFDYKTISRWFPASEATLKNSKKIGHVDVEKFNEVHLRELKKRLLKIVNAAGFEFVNTADEVLDILIIGADISFISADRLQVRPIIKQSVKTTKEKKANSYSLIFFENASTKRSIGFACDRFDNGYEVVVIDESTYVGSAKQLGPAMIFAFQDSVGHDTLNFNFSSYKKEHILMIGTFSGLYNGVAISGKAALLKEVTDPPLDRNEMIEHAEFHLLGCILRVRTPIHITGRVFATENRVISNIVGTYKGRFINPSEESFQEFIFTIARNGSVSVWLKNDSNSPYTNGYVRKYAANKILHVKFDLRDLPTQHFFSGMKFYIGRFDGATASSFYGVLSALDFEKTVPFVSRVKATKLNESEPEFSVASEIEKLKVFYLSEPGSIDKLKDYLKKEGIEDFFGGKERTEFTGLAKLYSKGVISHQIKLDL